MRKKKNLQIRTAIGHARKHLEDGNKIGAIESVRTDTDYSPTDANTLIEFIELFTIVENNTTVARHWCEEHRTPRFKCVNQHPEKLHADMQFVIENGGTNRDDAAEVETLAEFTRSVSFCYEHHVQRSECARLHQEIERQPQQPKPTEAQPTTPLPARECACNNASCENPCHRLAMWIKDNPFEWQRVIEEIAAPSQNIESANELDENLPR